MSEFKPTAIIELENVLSTEKIEQLKNNFIKNNYYEEASPVDIDSEKGIIYEFDGQIGEVRAAHIFENYLEKRLLQITDNLKSEIEQANIYLSKEEQAKYFSSLINSFRLIEQENLTTFEKFKTCYKPQKSIELYLKQKYDLNIPYKSEIELVHSVFDYMKGKGQKNQILNETDFNLLIQYTEYLVKQEQVPTIEKKIEPNLTQGVISFSYWVLHKELYNSHRSPKTRELYATFLKTVFKQFNNVEKTSIKNQFGVKGKCHAFDFLPQIITQYLD